MPIDMQKLVQDELRYFDSKERVEAVLTHLVSLESVQQRWEYSDAKHVCTIVAQNDAEQIVYCPTGFGPAYPWSVQRIGETDLGMDGEWCAYLYECVVGSSLSPSVPAGFELMGPGERIPPLR